MHQSTINRVLLLRELLVLLPYREFASVLAMMYIYILEAPSDRSAVSVYIRNNSSMLKGYKTC